MSLPATQALDICQTEYCQTAAASVLNYIDFNVNPCDDFYQYTCGSWLANVSIPDDKSAVGTLNQVNDDNIDSIYALLQGTYDDMVAKSIVDPTTDDFQLQSQRELDEKLFKKLQTYFQSCMNVERIDSLGATPIYPSLASVFASLPDEDSDKAPDSKLLTQLLIASHDTGSNTLVAMGVNTDDKEPNMNAVWADQSKLGLPSEEYYSQEEAMTIYQQGLNEIMKYILAHPTPDEPLASLRLQQSEKANLRLRSEDEVTEMVGRVIAFEKELAKIVMKEEDHRDPLKTYNPMTPSQLQERYPFIEWETLLRNYIPDDRAVPDKIVVNAPSYFEKLNDLLQSGKVTMGTLRDYLAIRAAGNWIYTLDTHTRTLLHEVDSKIISGASELKPRKQECISNANDALGHLVARYFTITKFGGRKEQDAVEEMIRLVHETWLNRLADIDWLDSETKEAAINKVNKIKHKVAYSTISPNEQSPESLDAYYATMSMTDSFFENEMSVLKWSRNKTWNRIGQPVDKDEWDMMAQEVNAYYSLTNNEMAVLDGILQYPVYNPHWPIYLNFGSLGMVIGHELTHAFDNAGRNYDANGELAQWWTNDTAARFQEKSQCFVSQYQNFTVQGPNNESLNVNGNLTLGENLADNGGIDVAYQAFRQAWDGGQLSDGKQVDKYRLPGVDLSPEALFYVSFGRLWCKSVRPQYAAKLIYTSEHSPDRVRVNGALQNSPEFSRVFNCPVGSFMNPEIKCHIW